MQTQTRSAMRPAPSTLAIVAALLVVSLAFGGNFLWIRVVVQSVPPLILQATRFFCGGAILYVLAMWRTSEPPPNAIQWRNAAVGGALLIATSQGLLAWSEVSISAGLTVLLASTIPIWTTVLGAIFLGERPSALGVAGTVIGFLGLIPIVLSHGTSAASLVPVFALLGAALCWAVGTLLTQRLNMHPDGFVAAAMQLLCGGTLLAAASLVLGEEHHIAANALSPINLAGIAYLTIIGSIVGYATYVWLVRRAHAAVASMFAYIQTVFAVYLGWLILHETVTLGMLAGGAAVITGVALVVATRK